MRTSSTTKKRPQFDKYIQSRVLITSHQINPLSQHISTKLDLIKQQISRQFHEKYPSDKKRSGSMKKSNSSSKSKLIQNKNIQSLSKKLNYHNHNNDSSSKSKKLLNNNNIITISNQDSQNLTFRQKYYELQDRLISERKKMIDQFQKNAHLKQKIMEFLQDPSEKTVNELQQHFSTDRQKKILQKFISMSQDIQYAQKTLSQLLTIVQVQNIQSLIVQLKARQSNCKNFSEFSYKILQLQTSYNKLLKQSNDKIQMLQNQANTRQNTLHKQLQTQQTKYLSQQKDQQQKFKQTLKSIIQKIQTSKQLVQSIQIKNNNNNGNGNGNGNGVMFVTFDRIPSHNDSEQRFKIHRYASLMNQQQNMNMSMSIDKMVNTILQIFKQRTVNVQEIKKQAQLNIIKLKDSKQDMERLQGLIDKVGCENQEEKNKIIDHFQLIIHQKQKQIQMQRQKFNKIIDEKQQHCNTIQHDLQDYKQQINQLQQKIIILQNQKKQAISKSDKKQYTINKIIKVICDTTGQDIGLFGLQTKQQGIVFSNNFLSFDIQQIVLSKIQVVLKRHLLTLKQNLQAAENMILWHQKQLEIKQHLLKQFDYNLKKFVQDSEISQQREKQVTFERDQYKYLLTSLRNSIREMKMDHQAQLVNLGKKKDDQYLNSNRDILLQNQRLNQQINILKTDLQTNRTKLRSQSTSHTFFKKKSQQLDQTIAQLRTNLQNSQSQVNKYRDHLNQIQISFKQVQSMSQTNSIKLTDIQRKYAGAIQELKQSKIQNQGLVKQIQVKDQSYNKVKFQNEEIKTKYSRIVNIRQDLQLENSNLRLKSIKQIEEIHTTAERLKKSQYQNSTLVRQNKKLMMEINQLTNKLLNKISNKQYKYKENNNNKQQAKAMKQKLDILKIQLIDVKSTIKNYLKQFRIQFDEYLQQINKHLIQSMIKLYQVNIQQKQRKQNHIQQQNIKIDNRIAIVREQNKANNGIINLKELSQNMMILKQNIKNIVQQYRNQYEQLVKYIIKCMMLNNQSISIQNKNRQKLSIVSMNLQLLRDQNRCLRQYLINAKNNDKLIIQEYGNIINVQISTKMKQICDIYNMAMRQHNQSITKNNQKEQNLLQNSPMPNKKIDDNQQLLFMSPQFVPISRNSQIQDKDKQTEIFIKQKQKQEVQIQVQGQDKQKQQKQEQEFSNQMNQLQQQNMQNKINSQRYSNMKAYSFRHMNQCASEKGDEMFNLRWSGVNSQQEEINRVKNILLSLLNKQGKQPNIQYFKMIKNQYNCIKKKLIRNLNIDISAVSIRQNSLSSPSSVSFSKDFLTLDRRFNTQPNEDPVPLLPRQTNRSQENRGQVQLQKICEDLRDQVQMLNEQLKLYEDREEEYKIKISELEKENVKLQNQASSQMKQKLFVKFITQLCKQNWKQAENSCRIMLKLVGIHINQINQRMNQLSQFIAKFQKKKSGFFSNFSSKNSKK